MFDEDIYLFLKQCFQKEKEKKRNGFAVRSILSWWVVKLSKLLKNIQPLVNIILILHQSVSVTTTFHYWCLSHTCSCALMYEDKFITHLNTNYCCDDEPEDVLFAATASKHLHLSTEA